MMIFKKLLKIQVLFLVIFLMAGGTCPVDSVLAQEAETEAVPMAEESEPVAAAMEGDPQTGRMLFNGEMKFVNGGPACIACHNVGEGKLGGGALGPNLISGPNLKGGPAPTNPLLNSMWINNEFTPVMGAIFSKKNITDDEVTHLKAYFSVVAGQPSMSSGTGAFVGIGAAGFVGILIFFGITWSGRYRKRVGGTAHEAIWRNYGGKGGQK